MRQAELGAVAVVLALGCGGGAVDAGARGAGTRPGLADESQPARDAVAVPPAPGSSLPTPPQQRATWAPPRELPAAVAEAGRRLFEVGLADPRGCAYRVVTVRAGDVWRGDAGDVETHAFVFPDGEHAVAWNGLVYRVAAAGAEADVAADVRASIASWRGLFAQGESMSPFDALEHTHYERGSLDPAWIGPVGALLLARLGRGSEARDLWAVASASPRSGDAPPAPMDVLREGWLWFLFDRALTAHMRGADAIALGDARMLVAARDALVPPRPENDHLATIDILLAEQERRARERAASPATGRPAADVAGLIARLDDVAARQTGQPGGVDLAGDEIIRALVAHGDAAVDPLIDVLETDTRLTRSVHFWRDFASHRSILTVAEAAYVALANILEASFFETVSTGDDLSSRDPAERRRIAAAIRAHWQAHRAVPREQRWYRVLADDAAGARRWIEAASSIVQPENVEVQRGSMFGTGWVITPGGPPGGMRGEALRTGQTPTVTDLIARRVDGLRTGADLDEACALAEPLVAWDAAGGGAALDRLATRCTDAGASCSCAASLVTARARGGNTTILDRWARWIRGRSFGDADMLGWRIGMLEPLWTFPDHPAMRTLGPALFGPGTSDWVPTGSDWTPSELVYPHLLAVPAIREWAVRALGDTRVIGELEHTETGFSIEYRNGGGTSSGWAQSDAPLPPPGPAGPWRRADDVANAIAGVRLHLDPDSTPVYRPHWPLARRDAAIAALARELHAGYRARP